MKNVLILLSVLLFFSCTHARVASFIRINQLGFYPKSNKIVVVANSDADSFKIKNTFGKIVFTGKLSSGKQWEASGEIVKTGDFSELETIGSYSVIVNNDTALFHIKNELYKDAVNATAKAFYYQRMSIPIEEKYAGVYKRTLGHPDTACYFHPSSGHTQGFISSPGGWYDAGDYNKYTVNSGITLGFLMHATELYPNLLPDGSLNIPESGNGKGDMLDEIRFELDWLLTMQDKDGGVFFKITNLKFDPFVMPELATEKRYVVGKSTTSALCFAANMAQASRVYSSDAVLSKRLLQASENAYSWAKANPSVSFKNPSDVFTGEYGDGNFDEEFFWAASELFVTTNESKYLEDLKKWKQPFKFDQGDNWRSFLGELAYYSLTSSKSKLPETDKEAFKNDIIKTADSILLKLEQVPYRIPMEKFVWGSNSDIADGASVFAFAYKLNGDKKYLNAALETTDYIFGKNATGYSFVTGFGSNLVQNIHHRLSASDDVPGAIPGFLCGGPNADRQDEGNKADQVQYPFHEPAKSYVDMQKSFASNEIAINWNAPLFFVLSFFENEIKP